MRKTLQDVAQYLCEIMVPEATDAYLVKSDYLSFFPGESIYEGVIAFRSFLKRLYTELDRTANPYDTSKKVAHEYENRTTLSVYYPFIHHVSRMLMKIGYQGRLIENGQAILCENTIFNQKLSHSKNLECLQFLINCGIVVEGNVNSEIQNLADNEVLKVSYPDNPVMLIGMKIMAIAEIEHGTLVNQDIFLRCDFRELMKDETSSLSIVQDTIKPLSSKVQNFVIQLHQRYLEKGLTCVVEIKGFHIYIKYCYKRKDLWGINASLNNGYHINIKSTRTPEYMDVVSSFSVILQELIAKGYGCGRKREIGHCDGGCRGLTIPLDDSVLKIKDEIITWLDQEIACLSGK